LNILFVTIVEIHTLILDVCVCPKETFGFIRTTFKKSSRLFRLFRILFCKITVMMESTKYIKVRDYTLNEFSDSLK